MSSYTFDYEVLEPGIIEKRIIELKFIHLFNVNVLGRFWNDIINKLEGDENNEIKSKMRGWLDAMFQNNVLVEPFDSIPLPAPLGTLPLLPRYNYTNEEIDAAITAKLSSPLNNSFKDTSTVVGALAVPRRGPLFRDESFIGEKSVTSRNIPTITEETTITQAKSLETDQGTVIEVTVMDLEKPETLKTSSGQEAIDYDKITPRSKRFVGKYNPFAPSEPEVECSTPKVIQEQLPKGMRVKKHPHGFDPFAPSKELEFTPRPGSSSAETQLRTLPKGLRATKFPPGKDPFAPSEELQSSKTARTPPKKESLPVERTKTNIVTPPNISVTQATGAGPVAPRKKPNQFASSFDWKTELHQDQPQVEKPRQKTVPPSNVTITQPPESGSVAPRQKPNQFASSFDWKNELQQDQPQVEKPRPKTVPPSTVTITQPPESGSLVPRQKPNQFASSMDWNNMRQEDEEPKSVTQSTIVKRAQTVETANSSVTQTLTMETKQVDTGENLRANYLNRKADKYKSSIGFGSYPESPPKRATKKALLPEPTQTQQPTISDNYQQRKENKWKSSIGFGPTEPTEQSYQRSKVTQPPPPPVAAQNQATENIYQRRRQDAYRSNIPF